MEIFDALPDGYRWATCDEAEWWMRYPGMIQVRVGGPDDEPWTDLALPSHARED